MQLDQLFSIRQTLVVNDGLGDPTDFVVEVVGRDSRPYAEAWKKTRKLTAGKEEFELDQDLLAQLNAELTASHIVGWKGLTDIAGNEIPYSKEKAVELMGTPELKHIADQIDAYAAKRANFFRQGAGSTGQARPSGSSAKRASGKESVAA